MTDWDGLGAKDQWLWLVRAEIEGLLPPSNLFAGANPKEDSVLSSLIKDHIERRGGAFPYEVKESRLDAKRFLTAHYRAIFFASPLRDWYGVLDLIRADALPFTGRERTFLKTLSDLWSTLTSRSRKERIEAIEPMVKFLVSSLGWSYVKAIEFGNVKLHAVNLNISVFNLPPIVPIIVSFVGDNDEDAGRAVRYTTDLQRALVGRKESGRELIINLVACSARMRSRYSKRMQGEGKFLPLFEGDLQRIYFSDRYAEGVRSWIQGTLGLARLNPYTTEKPVEKPDMFFGREEEIRRVLDNPSKDFMVVGSRRIGKSSLLRHLAETTRSSRSRCPVLLDCATIESAQDFAVALTNKVNPRRSRRITLAGLPQMIRANQSAHGLRYLLLFDEMDELVKRAVKGNDWSIFAILRELSNERLTQTIFTGYKPLYEAWKDIRSPIYNFVTPIYLATLTEESAKSLATLPLRALGVTYKSQKLVARIVRETGGHPSFLQFVCAGLVTTLDRSREREILPKHIYAVRSQREYRDFVLKPLEYKDNISLLERLLLLYLVRERQPEFDVDMVLEILGGATGVKTRDILSALQNLEIAGFIRFVEVPRVEMNAERGQRYSWTIPAFSTEALRSLPVEREIQELEKELGVQRENQDA